jgi:hypothetical protein
MAKVPQQANTKPTFADIKKKRKPNLRSVWIQIDPSYEQDLTKLRRSLRIEQRKDERENRSPLGPGIEAAIEELEEKAEESKVEFIVSSIGNQHYRRLVDEHPPTDQDREKDPDAEFNYDEFAPALIHACTVQPKLTKKNAQEIYNDWDPGEVNNLFLACTMVQLSRGSTVPFSDNGIEEILASLPSLTIAQSEESPTGSS